VELSKKSLTAVVKPYKASSKSPSLVITIPKFFIDILKIDLDTNLVIKVNQDKEQLTIDLADNVTKGVVTPS